MEKISQLPAFFTYEDLVRYYDISPNIRFFHNKIRDSRNLGIHFYREYLLITYYVTAFLSLGHSRTEQNPYSLEN